MNTRIIMTISIDSFIVNLLLLLYTCYYSVTSTYFVKFLVVQFLVCRFLQ